METLKIPNFNNIVVGFEFGPTKVMDIYHRQNNVNNRIFQSRITGLTPGTTYHFLTVASNGYGVSNGSDEQFTTLSGTTQHLPAKTHR